MYVVNSRIKPLAPNTMVWKYLDLSKFLDLLLHKQLFMARSDKFEDQYEGTFSEPTFVEIQKLSEHKPEFLEYYKNHRKNVVISSWHINDHESFAMWQIFTKSKEGIAIQSTVGKIQKALALEHDFEQHIGKVNYIDYKTQHIPFDDAFFPFLYKRKSFIYEKEVRIITDASHSKDEIHEGLKIDVDVEKLISKIYIHPKSENWYKKLIFELIDRLNLDFEIGVSDLESEILL
ncbi:MAG TPA: hypothetical protein VLZ11_00110 [Flavobacterium sp.]|nr:hypothetical protein [Flavobacterium sp.]